MNSVRGALGLPRLCFSKPLDPPDSRTHSRVVIEVLELAESDGFDGSPFGLSKTAEYGWRIPAGGVSLSVLS